MSSALILGQTEFRIGLNRSAGFCLFPSPRAMLNRLENTIDGSTLSGLDSTVILLLDNASRWFLP